MKNFEEMCFKEVLEGCLDVNHYIINKSKKDKKTKKRIKKVIQKINEELSMDELKDYIEDMK